MQVLQSGGPGLVRSQCGRRPVAGGEAHGGTAPGTGASLPGGVTPWQAYDALYRLGSDPRVKGFDLVEVDPSRDLYDITARLATKLILTFLAGYRSRPEDSRL